MADIVLVNPRFKVSYWGLEHALPLFGKAVLPTACLPLLAALTPAEHQGHIGRRKCRGDRLRPVRPCGHRGADRHERAAASHARDSGRTKRRGVFIVVGGPWVSVQEDYFSDLADVIFVGEAEETWPQFLAGLVRGAAPGSLRTGRPHRHDEGPRAASTI